MKLFMALGDNIVDKISNGTTYAVEHNVTLTFQYPKRSFGANITYVEFRYKPSSVKCRAYVRFGGIHQRHILFNVETYHTKSFHYILDIYGVK